MSPQCGGGASHRQFVAAEACDSFEGLKGDWYGSDAPSGTFGLGGQPPKVISNVTLVKGWFDNTLPIFLSGHPGVFSFLHLDADTFEWTALVLDLIKDRIANDEYIGLPNWQKGEFLAWQQFCERPRVDIVIWFLNSSGRRSNRTNPPFFLYHKLRRI